jgi:hypothetical protein
MDFIKFAKRYSTEKQCIDAFRASKEQRGIVCKKCGSTQHYWNSTHLAHDCKQCRYRTTLRSGTIMESSKLPFHQWYFAMYMMTMTKKGMSALEMQRQLGRKRYEPVWAMMHKIRSTMGNRDDLYELTGNIELDDAFFKTHNNEAGDIDKKKRGRGSQSQSKVLVMAKADPKVGRPKKHKKSSAFRYVKMYVMSDSSAVSVNAVVNENVHPDAKIKSDGWRGFNQLQEIVLRHSKKIVPQKESSAVLPWVHTMISNAKRKFLGIYHNVKAKYLQNYLNEFCYKTNRRYFGDKVFERLVIASVEDTWYGRFRYEYA